MPSNFKLLRNLSKDFVPEVEAVVKGKIPVWLNGCLYRNGPGRYEFGNKEYKHLFDGHACVHKFKINIQKVTYSNKFLQTESFKEASAKKTLTTGFADADPCLNLLGRFKLYFKDKLKIDNTNVNVVPFGHMGQLYALTETNMMCKLDPNNLDIMKTINITNYLPYASSTIAHPHIEEDGAWITMGMNTRGQKPCYNFLRYKPNNESVACQNGQLIAQIPSSHKMGHSYFHSFALSQNYIIYLEMALVFDFKQFFKGILSNKAFADALIMKKDWQTRIHLIERKTGQIVKKNIRADPMFVFHHINAFETYDSNETNNIKDIVIDVCSYDTSFDVNKLTYKNTFNDQTIDTKPLRIVVPNIGQQSNEINCKIEEINPRLKFEFPIINYDRFNGKPYSYFYGTNVHRQPFSIVKQNVQDRDQVWEFKFEDDKKSLYLPSEPVFVERPGAVDEDDGVLLVMVLAEDRDFLCVLDAKNLTEIARAYLPEQAKAAVTFHGFYSNNS